MSSCCEWAKNSLAPVLLTERHLFYSPLCQLSKSCSEYFYEFKTLHRYLYRVVLTQLLTNQKNISKQFKRTLELV